MYIGSTGPRGLHHLFVEVVDNGIDEALAGRATEITCVLHADDSFSVTDTAAASRRHPSRGAQAGRGGGADGAARRIEVWRGAYKVSGGLHGVGVSS